MKSGHLFRPSMWSEDKDTEAISRFLVAQAVRPLSGLAAVKLGCLAFEVGSFLEPLLFNRGSEAQSFFPTWNSGFY